MRDEANKPRPGIHGSNLLYCLRKAVFEKLEDSYDLDDNTIHTFGNGKAWHEHIQNILTRTYPGRFLVEHELVNDGIIYHPDLIDVRNNVIIELKTVKTAYALGVSAYKEFMSALNELKADGLTESELAREVAKETEIFRKKCKPKPDHVNQIRLYMAVAGIYNGRIVYHPLSTEELEPELHEFTVTITDEVERELILKNAKTKATMLANAVERKDPLSINVDDIVNDWGKNWMCWKYCPYVWQCPEGLRARRIRNERSKRPTLPPS